MKELVKVYQDRGTKFIEDLFNDYVVITEKLSGSSFSFQKDGHHLSFYKGDSRRPINLIDRTLMIYYEPPIQYILSLPNDVLREIPDNWRFSFQYFVNNNPGVIAYDKMPKNNLVLTHILVKDERGKNAKVIEDPRVIKDWAKKLDVTPMQPIFQGHLDKEQKDKLIEFLDIPVEDQIELFGTNSFVEYLVKSLNPSIDSTLLNTDLSKPIDSIIFKFYKPGSTQTYSAKMVDPYTRSLMKEKEPIDLRRAPADINEIVLLDLLAFLEERGLKKHEVLSQHPEEKYLELVSGLFNDYVDKRGEDLAKLDFQRADFAKAPEFDVNYDLLRNDKTKKLIMGSEALKDLFKVMLGSLRKKRDPNKEGSLFTRSVIEDFNKMVDKIKKITEEKGDGKFKTFEDYLNLKNMNEEVYISDDVMDLIIEERYFNFKDFVNLEKLQINEALKVPHKKPGNKKVNVFVGRFQPFTLGHLKVLETLHKENGLPVMVMLVRGGKPDPEKRPFDVDAQQRMIAALQKQYPFIEGSEVIPNGSIDTLYSALRPAYEPILWGYGTDRKKNYDGMINHPSYRDQLGVDPEFKGHEIKRGDEDISASKVRRALQNDDRKTYERMVPRSLHDFYDELQNIMIPIEESLLLIEGATARQKAWVVAYFNHTKSKDYVGAKSKEILRANFGSNDGEAEKNIETFLTKRLKVNKRFYDIEQYSAGSFIPGVEDALSGQFDTYKISFKKDVKILGEPWTVGENIYITNRYKVSAKTGEAAVIKGKDLTPDAIGLPSSEYHNASPLMSSIRSYVDTTSYPDNYKDFIISSAEAVLTNSKNSGKFTDFEEYANAGTPIVYNVGIKAFDGIDQVSIANFQNDFGEVLGGLMMFNVLKDTGDGLRYPTASNEKLVDFYFDDYKVSSKAGGGGTPSGSTIMNSIYNAISQGQITPDMEESTFYETVTKPWLFPVKLDKRSTTYNSVMNLAADHLGPNTASGYSYLLSEAEVNQDTATREALISFLDDLSNDPKAFDKFLNTFISKTGSFSGKIDAKKYREEYIKRKEGGNDNRIGLVFYPIMVETVKILNEKYASTLTSLTQKVSDVKQVYLDTLVKKGQFIFKTKKFSTSNFVFQQKANVWSPFNSMMGIKLIK